jgi:cyclase
MKITPRFLLAPILAFYAFAANAAFAFVEPVKVTDSVTTFKGPLANCVALVTSDGVLVVDSGESLQFGAQILEASQSLSNKPVRYLVNTHYHFDHAHGNSAFADAGVQIIAQKNTRDALVKEGILPRSALPTITFEEQKTILLGDEEIVIYHPETGGAHTGGDAVVYFKKANVLCTGDLMFAGLYPSIDSSVGGWSKGMAESCRHVAALIDEATIVIPGHGALTGKKELLRYADMLEDISNKVEALMNRGLNLDQIIAEHPTKDWDERCSSGSMPKPYKVTGDDFVKFVYWSLQAHEK